MREINIGRILIENRHKCGITQDELANHMGVSKASVSKWETGTTYPDITILPQLASFFNISIDELMGYEPQMCKEDIRRLYQKLTLEFSEKPFDEVMDQCRNISQKYFSCAPLLFQIGALYVNHCMMAGAPEKTKAILEEAKELFVRVKGQSDDPELAAQAVSMEAYCLLQLGRANEVLTLLEPLEIIKLSTEPLLASAYRMTGDKRQAKQVLQTGIYKTLLELLNLLTHYMDTCAEDEQVFEETCHRMMALTETFHLEKLHPSVLLSLYLVAAQGFLAQGNKKKAMDMLESYTELVLSEIYPLKLHGDSYFDLLDEWLEKNLALGSNPPRAEKVIRKSMVEAVADNPVFLCLKEEPEFRNILRRLKAEGEGSL